MIILNSSIFNSRNEFKKNWMDYVYNNLGIRNDRYLSDLFDRNYVDERIELYKSSTGETFYKSSSELLPFIIDKCVIVENGVLFYNHNTKKAPIVEANTLHKLGRKMDKNEMKKAMAVEDIITSNYYNNSQLGRKISMNTEYGASINAYNKSYNYDVADSTTMRGRSSVTLVGLTIEWIFSDLRYHSLKVHLHHINNCIKKDISKYTKYLDDVSVEDTLHHLLKNHYDNYYAIHILRDRLAKLSSEDLKKVYYSGNIKAFYNIKYINELVANIFRLQNENYNKIDELEKRDDKGKWKEYKSNILLDPMSPPKYLIPLMEDYKNWVQDLLFGFYWYEGDILSNGTKTDSTQEKFHLIYRKRAIINDTDSIMVALKDNMDDMMNNIKDFTKITNNFSDKYLHYVVASMVINTLSLITEVGLNRYTTQTLIPKEYRHNINYKQEFLYNMMQVTEAAKNYLGVTVIQEGVLLPKVKIDIKGLSMKKSNFNQRLSSYAKDISINMIALKEVPNTNEIISKINDYRKEIKDLYKSKDNLELFTVNKLKVSFGGLPEGESRIKACRLYEALYDKSINLPGAFLETKIKFEGREEELKEDYPDMYDRLTKEALRRTKNAIISRIDNKLNSMVADDFAKLGLHLENTLADIKLYAKDIMKSKDTDNIKKVFKELKSKYKDIFNKMSVSITKISDINKIAIPLDSESVDPFITEFIDSDEIDVFDNLAATIVKGIGIEVIRNKGNRQIITNTVTLF